MSDFPYTPVNGRIKPLLDKISQVGRPTKVDKKWLESVGFKGSNDVTLLRILKAVEFLDSSGVTTDKWQAYRDKSRSRQVMADAVRGAYPELFAVYPDACQRSEEDLRNFFHSKSTANASTIGLMVAAFKILCDLADFSATAATTSIDGHAQIDVASLQTPAAPELRNLGSASGVTVNVNIQLSIPETTDPQVYDNFFAALRKHLLSQ